MRILIVDDSVVFRSQIKLALTGVANIEVAATAANGRIALDFLKADSSIDLVTLDVEMPELDGIQTLQEIRKISTKVRVIMVSSKTARGAQVALEALRKGADDVVSKPQGTQSFEASTESLKNELIPRILQFARVEQKSPVSAESSRTPTDPFQKVSLIRFKPQAVVIGSSTGGPVALETIFKTLQPPLSYPVFITQHMPPVFTKSLADRLAKVSGLVVDEGKHDEVVLSNRVYIAPGNFHMTLVKNKDQVRIQLDQRGTRNSVRPAVDYLFETAAEVFKNQALGVILTGMGEDGLQGSISLKKAGAPVVIQNQETCVVFGMPGAIYNAGAYDRILSLEEISSLLSRVS